MQIDRIIPYGERLSMIRLYNQRRARKQALRSKTDASPVPANLYDVADEVKAAEVIDSRVFQTSAEWIAAIKYRTAIPMAVFEYPDSQRFARKAVYSGGNPAATKGIDTEKVTILDFTIIATLSSTKN